MPTESVVKAAMTTMALLLMPTSIAGETSGRFERLVAEADVIALVEVVSTDYTATAADGPAYVEAKVLKVIKGDLPTWRNLRFGASGWVGPSYKTGERRIVFLDRLSGQSAYYRKTRWSSIEAGKLDLFFTPESLEDCSLSSLAAFLNGIEQVTPPELRITWTNAGTLAVDLVNNAQRTLWLNPTAFWLSLQADQVIHPFSVTWDIPSSGDWVSVEPGSTLSGRASGNPKRSVTAGAAELVLAHRSVLYPYPSWVGATSAKVGGR